MAASQTTALAASVREPSGSRSARRLRRAGNIPGIVYGGGQDPVAFEVNSRELRNALAHAGAVLDLQLDGAGGTPVVLKELVRHPVSGETVHLDLLRVRLDVKIQAQVVIELIGADDAPGVKEGGTIEHSTRELTVEALPTSIPDGLRHDVSEMKIGDTLVLADVAAPDGVTIIGEPDTLIAALHPPRVQAEDGSEIEAETEVVGAPAETKLAESDAGSGDAGASDS
ncbi:MAG: 50S ribosomal protein L25 [Solirubrobacteraceae bacterium]